MSFSTFEKNDEGSLVLEFKPEEIGLHEVRVFSNKSNRAMFNTFEFAVYDSTKLKISANDEAIVGKLYKFLGIKIFFYLSTHFFSNTNM
jgi:hypothetical protein